MREAYISSRAKNVVLKESKNLENYQSKIFLKLIKKKINLNKKRVFKLQIIFLKNF